MGALVHHNKLIYSQSVGHTEYFEISVFISVYTVYSVNTL